MKIIKLLVFIVGCALAVLLTANPGPFLYSRAGIAEGEVWRLFTGHFVHFTSQHLYSNIIAFALLLVMMPRLHRVSAMWIGLCTPLLLAATLYATRMDLAFYGGISGWLTALFVYVALERSATPHWSRHFFRVGLLFFAAKLLLEWILGKSLFFNFAAEGIVVESAAHLFGAILGGTGALLARAVRHQGTQKPARSSTFSGEVVSLEA